ncbi:MAG: alanine racemase [Caldilineaceae bacterium]|nr:alanine racemase [Caldilineaceae bacterium]
MAVPMIDAARQVPNRASWIEISADAIVNNVAALRDLLKPTTKVMAVVKGNAYGHGAALVAKVVQGAGVDQLAVATVDEGIELRHQGTALPILVLGHTPTSGITAALHHALTLTLHRDDNMADLAQVAQSVDRRAVVHLKVNTGMNRLGVDPADVVPFVRALHAYHPHLQLEGIFTHFATADHLDQTFAQEQLSRFQQALQALTAVQLRPPLAHAANSAAILQFPAAQLDMVRCGIALYGLHPDAETCRLSDAFQPVLRWKAQIAQLTRLQPGEGVGYGQTFRAEQPTVVATIPIGYADGFPRSPHHWGSVLIHGAEAPILGRVCMDQTIVDVTPLTEQGVPVQPGDEVVLIGRQRQRQLTTEEIAERLGTVNYEVVSRILPRVPRVLV